MTGGTSIAMKVGIYGLIVLAGGCATSPYVRGYTYVPQPAIVDVYRTTNGNPQVALTTLVSILGVRNADPARHIPYSVAIRMRFEDVGPAHALFDPRTLDLVSGTLQPFGPPQARPDQPIELSPGQQREVSASFPFPPGTAPNERNLSHLRLRWQVVLDGYPVQQTALFDRAQPDYNYDTSDSDLPY